MLPTSFLILRPFSRNQARKTDCTSPSPVDVAEVTRMVFPKVGQPASCTALLHGFAHGPFRYWQVSFMMPPRRCLSSFLVPVLLLICLADVSVVQAQGAKQRVPDNPVSDPDADHVKER